jgi:uncharacterized protein (DUF1697 family)
MNTFVALLRGINVGKAKRVAMADWRAQLQVLGYQHVQTLLNSGNAVFHADHGSPAEHALRIADALETALGWRVATMVVSADGLRAIVEANPLTMAAEDPSKFMVGFADAPAVLERCRPLARLDWSPEAFAVGSSAVYLWCAAGVIESRAAKVLAKAAGEGITLRNWATVLKLQAACTTLGPK